MPPSTPVAPAAPKPVVAPTMTPPPDLGRVGQISQSQLAASNQAMKQGVASKPYSMDQQLGVQYTPTVSPASPPAPKAPVAPSTPQTPAPKTNPTPPQPGGTPSPAATPAPASTSQDNGTSTPTPVTTPGQITPPTYDITAETAAATQSLNDYQKAINDTVMPSAQANMDVVVKNATDNYTAEQAMLEAQKQQMQTITDQKNALVETSSDEQKADISAQYDQSQKALALQQTKTDEAYQDQQDAQALANTQSNIREETMLGMVYGGFGSVAANDNLEANVLAGEKALQIIKRDATDADTDIQNQVDALGQTYASDLGKVDQWKAEQINTNYSDLQQFIMKTDQDEMTATVDKNNAITGAVTAYNTKVGEVNASSALMKYNLATALQDKATTIKQQMFENSITAANANAAADAQKKADAATATNDATQKLGVLLQTYSDKNYADLPANVKAQIDQLTQAAGLPDGFAAQAITIAKAQAALAAEGHYTPETTYDSNGNPIHGSFNTQNGTWSDENSNGNTSSGPGSGPAGTIQDALNVKDGTNQDEKGNIIECGHFVNQFTGLQMGNSYESKIDAIKPYIVNGPHVGDVYVMKTDKAHDPDGYGHTGFVESVSADGKTFTSHSANLHKDGAVSTDTLNVDGNMTFATVPQNGGGQNNGGGGGQNKLVGDLLDQYTSGSIDEKDAVQQIKNEVFDPHQQEALINTFTKGLNDTSNGQSPVQKRAGDEMTALVNENQTWFDQNVPAASLQKLSAAAGKKALNDSMLAHTTTDPDTGKVTKTPVRLSQAQLNSLYDYLMNQKTPPATTSSNGSRWPHTGGTPQA